MATRAELEAYLRFLHATELYDEKDGFHYWDNGYGCRLMCCTCTDGAILVAHHFGGEVWGFANIDAGLPSNPYVARDCSGHDFALVDGFLVDYWGQYVEGKIPNGVLDLNDPELSTLYGPRDQWECVIRSTPLKPASSGT